MSINELLSLKNISLFIGIASLIMMVGLFLGNRRKLTARRIIALSITCLLGFAYYFNRL